MASIPLPALDSKVPQQPDLLENYSRLAQLNNMLQNAPLQRQALEQQVQGGQLENQMRQRDLAASQAINDAYKNAVSTDANGRLTFDESKMQNSLMSGPAAYKTPEVMEGLTKFKKAQVDLQNSQQDLQGKLQDMIGNAAAAIKASGYDPNVAHAILDSSLANPAMANSPQVQQIRSMIDNPQSLKQWTDMQIAQSPAQQKLQNAKDVATIRSQTPEMQQMDSWLRENPDKTPADYKQHLTDMQTNADIKRETDPRVMAAKSALAYREAAARQALSQGDPNAAGQLMANGDLTLGELKTRGATPDFIAKATLAAKRFDPNYNPQEAEAQLAVAKSPANVAFFGSAKSLTDKGGTLDQLEQAAKDIPQGQFPKLNSLADWEKAATGSGPIAKYASLALGVADDYSKVMGGGQGSDASRAQALNLVGASQSPQQRAASIEGIRGAVSSQTNSRIGNNAVMKRMYGDIGGSSAGISVGSVITQNGHRYKVTAIDKNGKPTAADPL